MALQPSPPSGQISVAMAHVSVLHCNGEPQESVTDALERPEAYEVEYQRTLINEDAARQLADPKRTTVAKAWVVAGTRTFELELIFGRPGLDNADIRPYVNGMVERLVQNLRLNKLPKASQPQQKAWFESLTQGPVKMGAAVVYPSADA